MVQTYRLLFETIEEAPALDIEYKAEKMASGGDFEDKISFLSSPLPSVLGEQQRKERGERKPTDIMVETINSPGDDSWARAASASLARKSSSKSRTTSKEGTPVDGARSSKEGTPGERRGKETSPLSMDDRLNYISGNPFVEVTKGVIHLFKLADSSVPMDTELMMMMGVPAKHKTLDLLQLTAPCHQDLHYMRIVHDGSPNQYMVLLKFKDRQSASEFHSAYNGLPYNSLEPEVCCVLPVSKVDHCKESQYTGAPQGQEQELPYCTICLERMDESVSTVMTILCNHKFHSSCLAQWEDPTCPVCRYVQTPEVVTDHLCLDCQSNTDLWICLVCGYVGCGRYAGGHAHQHFLDTQHCYSMELGHNRVWDYVGDSFVHRLVQSQEDGKLVEQEGGGGREGVKGGGKHSGSVDGVAVDNEEKMDSLQLEYTYLLTSQLEDQRNYFQSKLGRVEEDSSRQVQALQERLQQEAEAKEKLEKELDLVSRERSKCETKVGQLVSKVSKLGGQLEEERQLNKSLRENQDEWQTRLKKAEVEVAVLQKTKDREILELQEQASLDSNYL